MPTTPPEVFDDLETIKKKLKEIFVYYASYGDRLNTKNLKSSKFYKLMVDAGIISNNRKSMTNTSEFNTSTFDDGQGMNKKRIDLIFCQVNKNKANMTFDIFLQALVKLSQFMVV